MNGKELVEGQALLFLWGDMMDDAVKRFRERRADRVKARSDAKEFEESEHPRGKDGRFVSGVGEPDGFRSRMAKYIGGGTRTDIFTEEDVQYIQSQMETTNKGLFRIEDGSWMADRLKAGQTFSFDNELKSFSRTEDGARNVLLNGEDYGVYENPVVFMTLGKTKHFNVGGYNDDHKEEAESLVGGKFRVAHIGSRQIGGKKLKCYFIEQK